MPATTMTTTGATSSSGLNLKNPAVRRIMAELKEFHRDPPDGLVLQPLEDNLSEVHFTFCGPPDSPYANGLYHGRIRLPSQYPFKPPSVYMSTLSGRFETDKNICLSVLNHYPENWQPAWGIRTVLLALSGFMVAESPGSIGSVEYTKEERMQLAKQSLSYECRICGMKHAEITLGSDVRRTKNDRKDVEEAFRVLFAGAEGEGNGGREREGRGKGVRRMEDDGGLSSSSSVVSSGRQVLGTSVCPDPTSAPPQPQPRRTPRRARPSSLTNLDMLLLIVSVLLVSIILRRFIL